MEVEQQMFSFEAPIRTSGYAQQIIKGTVSLFILSKAYQSKPSKFVRRKSYPSLFPNSLRLKGLWNAQGGVINLLDLNPC